MDRQQIQQSARSAIVTIKNLTTEELTRVSYTITSGIWKPAPPESIPPRSAVHFATISNGFMSGCGGEVIYSQIKQGDRKFTFKWNNSYIDLGNGKEYSATTTHPSLFRITQDGTKTNNYSVEWGVLSLKQHIQQDKNSEKKAPWKQEHEDTNGRSILISILNTTNVNFWRSEYELVQGNWSKAPPDIIFANTSIEFGAVGQKIGLISTGVRGKVAYKPEGSEEKLFFLFDNPLIGIMKWHINHTNDYIVQTTSTSANNGSLFFYILPKNKANLSKSLSTSSVLPKRETHSPLVTHVSMTRSQPVIRHTQSTNTPVGI
eukprot:TRINITY_DN2347_c0_g1_i2.p1 TRINITY_DN2347_c0_g1~~TRINITY_DN2347_c0_g1_i2.p1  ORF type:complete len:344 (+),score=26.99 TRINITY_DN2347_c0_g1_i2:79-1032(+)